MIVSFYNNHLKKIVILFFFSYFAIGLTIVDSYGVSSDEYSSRLKGFVTLNYLGEKIAPDLTNKIKKNKNIPDLKTYEQKIYGVVYEAPASFLEIIFKIDDKSNQFLLRHYLNFIIFFISTIFFFRILSFRFHNTGLALLGTFFLILSPRIFANSFYNNKDLVFLSFFIIASFYAIKFIKKQNLKNGIFFAVSSALAIDVRILGIAIPVTVFSINLIKNLYEKKFKQNLNINILSFIFVICSVIIFWPYLWASPIKNFIFAFNGMANFEIDTFNLFFEEYINAKNVGWNFIPTWIFITTPILYLIFFLVGLILLIKKSINFFRFTYDQFYIDLFFLVTLFGPLIAVIIFNSTLYNGWRQLYFIYPSIIFISIISLDFLNTYKNFQFKKIIYTSIILYLFTIVNWMTQNHPFQYVYFNSLIDKKELNKKFDLDYWGLSYKQNLEYLLKNEEKNEFNIYNLSQNKLFYSLFSLNKEDRSKFNVVSEPKNAEYIMTNFFEDKSNINNFNLDKYYILNEIIVDEYSINRIYKKKS
jgi:hypothetical protein